MSYDCSKIHPSPIELARKRIDTLRARVTELEAKLKVAEDELRRQAVDCKNDADAIVGEIYRDDRNRDGMHYDWIEYARRLEAALAKIKEPS